MSGFRINRDGKAERTFDHREIRITWHLRWACEGG